MLDGVRRFPHDPFERVAAEIQLATGAVARGVGPSVRGEPLTGAEAAELASALLEPDAARSELRAFVEAWRGSIEFRGGAASMTLPVFSLFLGRLFPSGPR